MNVFVYVYYTDEKMARIKVVTSSCVSKKIVEEILLKESAVAVTVKQKYLRKPGTSILQINGIK